MMEQKERRAAARARELGFICNEEVWALSINETDPIGLDSINSYCQEISPESGAVTEASLRWNKAHASRLLEQLQHTGQDLSMLKGRAQLLPGTARGGKYQLDSSGVENDLLVAALELEQPSAVTTPVVPPHLQLGHELLAYHVRFPVSPSPPLPPQSYQVNEMCIDGLTVLTTGNFARLPAQPAIERQPLQQLRCRPIFWFATFAHLSSTHLCFARSV
jgi:hypothetical protein